MKVLLLRGLLREARHWGHFPELVAKGLGVESRSVVTLDLPGIGSESSEEFPFSVEKARDALRTRWLQINSDGEEALLFSVSLGSMIAASWATSFPGDFKKGYVLTNTSASNMSGIQERISLEALSSFLQIMKQKSPLERETRILKLVSNRCNDDSTLLQSKAEEWARFALDSKSLIALGVRQLFAASRFQLKNSGQKIPPVLCLASLQDRLLSPAATMRVAEFFEAEQFIHHTAGHDLPLDDPDWVIQKVQFWLDQRPQ